MPKFFSDGHFSGSSTDLTIDGQINISGQNIGGVTSPTLYLGQLTNAYQAGMQSSVHLTMKTTNGAGNFYWYRGGSSVMYYSDALYVDKLVDKSDTSYYLDPGSNSILNQVSFGVPAAGGNTKARFFSIEGNADASGEGSGRIFFTEHNSTDASKSNYGMSLGYRGGSTSIVGTDGNTWTGLSDIGNGQWGMWGHNNSAAGSLIMYGDRAATFVNFAQNSINNTGDITGKSVNNAYSLLYKFGGLFFTWDSDSYGTNTHHSIRSTYGDTFTDSITLNSYNHFRVNIDSNNNNGTSYFEVGDGTTGTGNVKFRVDHNGSVYAKQAYYGLDNTNYYISPWAGNKNSGNVNAMRIRGRIYSDNPAGGAFQLRNQNTLGFGLNANETGMTVLTNESKSQYITYNSYPVRATTALVLGNTPFGTTAASSGKDIFNITRVNQNSSFGGSNALGATGQGVYRKILNLKGNGDLYLDYTNPGGSVYGSKFISKANTGRYLDPDGTSYLNALSLSSSLTIQDGQVQYFYTSAGNIRGYIKATETNDAHLIIATSGGEDIAFKDGGVSGTTNLISRGDGNLWVRGAIQNGTIAYSQVTGAPTGNMSLWKIGDGSTTDDVEDTETVNIIGGTNITVELTGDREISISNGITNNNQLTNGAGYLTSLPSHNHDDRYYTETEMQTFFDRGYIESHSASNLAVGWYTIATNTGDRALGEFQIWETASGDHQSVIFSAAHHFGVDGSNDITILNQSRYSGTNFRYIRIKEAGTYDGAALQVYIDGTSNSCNVAITGANAQQSGWVIKDWIADATDPGDVSSWSSFTEKTKVDLDVIINGGMLTTGEIYAGGQTTQYKVFHDNYHPNADKLTTARTIAGTSFDGSADIDISYANLTNKPTIPTNNNQLTNGAGYITEISIGSGTGLTGGGTGTNFNLNVDLNELTTTTGSGNADFFAVINSGGTQYKIAPGNINNSTFNNDAGYITSSSVPTNNNQLTNGAGYITSSSLGHKCTFTEDSAAGDDITSRIASGFYETNTPTASEGYPTTTQLGSSSWAHLLSTTHSNNSNYYAMQFAASFWNQSLFHRQTVGSGTTDWLRVAQHKDTTVQSGDWLRADKFYTYNDTTRYVDPANTSLMNSINAYGLIALNGYGKFGHCNGSGGNMLGFNDSNGAGATLGVNKSGQIYEYEKIITFKVSGSGWVNRSSNPFKIIQAPGADKMIIVDEFLVYIDYETRTGLGYGQHVARPYDSAAYSVGFYENETGQSQSTAAHGVSGTFYTLGIMPGGFMNNTADRGYYRDVPVHQSALIANRSLFWKTNRDCSSSNVPGGPHYIKVKYRVVDISDEFSDNGVDYTLSSSSYHGQYAHSADGNKQYNDNGSANC